MDYSIIVRSGFMGFVLSVGVLLLVFYVVGVGLRVARKHFARVLLLAGVVSFVTVYLYLHYEIRVIRAAQPELFLVGCIGGWLAGIFFGIFNLSRFLAGTLK
jgi:hypothetical protein